MKTLERNYENWQIWQLEILRATFSISLISLFLFFPFPVLTVLVSLCILCASASILYYNAMEYPIVLVKNIPFNASTNLLYDLFGKFGTIHQLRISDGLVPKGTCYVIYSSLDSAKQAAKELNGVNFHSRYLVAHMFAVDSEVARSELLRLAQQGEQAE